MSKYVTKTSIALTMIVPTVITIIAIAAWLTPQEWEVGPAILLITVVVGSWLWAATFVYRQYVTQPSFTVLGAAVWASEVPRLQLSEVRRALYFFCTYFEASNLHILNAGLDPKDSLWAMWRDARVEFTQGKPWLGARQVAGMQKGNWIKCQYGKGFGHNAFFHECAHMVDEMILQVEPDYRHTGLEVWENICSMKAKWRLERGEV